MTRKFAHLLGIAGVAAAALVLAGCTTGATSGSPDVSPATDPAIQFDDEWGGNGGSWIVRSEECLDVAEVQEKSEYPLIDKNVELSSLSLGCQYSNVEDTYAIGYYRITLPPYDGQGSESFEAPSLGVGARTFEQAAFTPGGCIVIVPLQDQVDVYLGITSNGGEDKPWREKCPDAVGYLSLLADQQLPPEPVEEAPTDASESDWIDCGPVTGPPSAAYRFEGGAFTFCADGGYLVDSEYGSVAVYDMGLPSNHCGIVDDDPSKLVCTDYTDLVYFFGLDGSDAEVDRPIVEVWEP